MRRKGSVPLTPGADSAAYDEAANVWYVVTGGKDVDMKTAEIEAMNPDTGKKLGEIKFNDNHVEAMALEKHGDRLFINLAQTNKVAVVNRKTMKEIAEWSVPPAKANAMVAFDEQAKRLVCGVPRAGNGCGDEQRYGGSGQHRGCPAQVRRGHV